MMGWIRVNNNRLQYFHSPPGSIDVEAVVEGERSGWPSEVTATLEMQTPLKCGNPTASGSSLTKKQAHHLS